MIKLIDLSQPIETGMPVFPGDTPTTLVQTKFLDRDHHNNHVLRIGMHVGTHLDGPMHLTKSKAHMSDLPLHYFTGEGCVLDVRNQAEIAFRDEFDPLVREDSIVLLHTGHDNLYGTSGYYENYPCVSAELCSFFIKRRIKMLGIDTPSPDRYPFPIHKSLLNAGIYILENLTNVHQLLNVPQFEIIALPLKIKADGSLTRAVARII